MPAAFIMTLVSKQMHAQLACQISQFHRTATLHRRGENCLNPVQNGHNTAHDTAYPFWRLSLPRRWWLAWCVASQPMLRLLPRGQLLAVTQAVGHFKVCYSTISDLCLYGSLFFPLLCLCLCLCLGGMKESVSVSECGDSIFCAFSCRPKSWLRGQAHCDHARCIQFV